MGKDIGKILIRFHMKYIHKHKHNLKLNIPNISKFGDKVFIFVRFSSSTASDTEHDEHIRKTRHWSHATVLRHNTDYLAHAGGSKLGEAMCDRLWRWIATTTQLPCNMPSCWRRRRGIPLDSIVAILVWVGTGIQQPTLTFDLIIKKVKVNCRQHKVTMKIMVISSS
jgi:hypothetical protein